VPDYSHFQSGFKSERNSHMGVAAVRMESHKHGDDGGWHLKIDVRLGPHHEIMLEAIKTGFIALIQSLSPTPPLHEENYYGQEADQQSSEQSLEDYYQQAHRRYIADDPWRSN
jgi:hypothetical protein